MTQRRGGASSRQLKSKTTARKGSPTSGSASTFSAASIAGFSLAALAAAAALYGARPWHHALGGGPSDVLGYLSYGRDKVEVKVTAESGAGLYASSTIAKGEVMYAIDVDNTLNSRDLREAHPALAEAADRAMKGMDPRVSPTANQLILSIALAMEKRLGEHSRWHAYVASLPSNITSMAWYWTPEEMACTVRQRFGAPEMQETLRNFHKALADVRVHVPAIAVAVPDPIDVEWAYLMVKTRSFTFDASLGSAFFPILDIANHNPMRGSGPYYSPKGPINGRILGTIYTVATQKYERGEQIWASYGPMLPSRLAMQYGFVDRDAIVVVASNSLNIEYNSSAYVSNAEVCTKGVQAFFASANRKEPFVIDAELPLRLGSRDGGKPMTHRLVIRDGMPWTATLECAQVHLQSRDAAPVAAFLASQLAKDVAVYRERMDAPECAGESGNFPLIREVNRITAEQLDAARVVADEAVKGGP